MGQGQTLGGPGGQCQTVGKGGRVRQGPNLYHLGQMSFFTSPPQSPHLYMGVPIPQPHPPVKEYGGSE